MKRLRKKLKDAGHSLDTRKMDNIERDRIRDVAKRITKRDYNRTTLMVDLDLSLMVQVKITKR